MATSLHSSTTAPHPRARCLQDLASEVRRKTIQLLEAAAPSELTWTPPGTANHLLWHAGHAVWLGDVLGMVPITGASELPPGWKSRFGMGSDPAAISTWPAKADVLAPLQAQLPRLLAVIGPLTDAELDARPPFAHASDPRTLGACILHGLHDEANHQGEMYLLLKLQRRARQPK